MPTHPIYTTGGTVQAGGGIYLLRQADADLFVLCQSGNFAYILTPRQMGKSSLMVQTAERLSQEGIRSAIIDLTQLGVQVTAEQWYLGLLTIIEDQLELATNVVEWWQERTHLGLTQRLTQFFQAVLLTEVTERVVIFVDEIDSTLSLDFTDDFFAAIRYFYVARAQESAFQRLSVVLIGVANPSDLIQDKSRTPFNIGRELVLEGFQLQEAEPLMAGLVDQVDRPQEVLRVVLDWTGGQPFLTQKLCQLMLQASGRIAAGREATLIEQVVRSRILDNWEAQDQPEHLRTIRDRLLAGGEQRSGRRLGLYQQIVQQGDVAADESPEQTELRLTGLVVKQQSKLHLYNRVYGEVFNLSWVEQELGKLRPYGNELTAWVASNRDESWLLRGQALQNALAWTSGKNLSDEDYRFLNASQEVEQRVAAEENRILEEARRKAEAKTKKANRRLKWSSLVAIAFIGLALMGFLGFLSADSARKDAIAIAETAKVDRNQAKQEANGFRRDRDLYKKERDSFLTVATNAKQQAKTFAQDAAIAKADRERARQSAIAFQQKAKSAEGNRDKAQKEVKEAEAQTVQEERRTKIVQVGTRLERQGTAALKQFEFQQIPALISSIQAGEELKDLLKDNHISKLIDYPATIPLLALQTILDRIRLQNISDFSKDRGGVRSTDFSPDGQYIVTTYENDTAYILNLSNQQEIKLVGDKEIKINRASFSPDGQYILTAYDNNYTGFGTSYDISDTYVWKLSGQQQAKLITQNNNKFATPSFSQDSRHILAISEAGSALIWDLSNQQDFEIREAFLLKEDQIISAKFSLNDQHIFTASKNGTVSIWNLSGQQLSSFKDIGVKSSLPIGATTVDCSISDLIPSPNGQYIVTSRVGDYYEVCGNFTRIWDLSGHLLAEFHNNSSNSFSPDSRFIVPVSSDETAIVWDLSRQQEIKLEGEKSETLNPRFTPNGQYIVTQDKDRHTTHLWNLSERKEFRNFKGQFVSFSPDGKLIVTTSGVWDLSGQKIAEIQVKDGTKIGFSENNKRLATIENRVLIWNLLSQQPIKIEGIGIASFSYDSQKIVTDDGRTIGVWSLSGKPPTQIPVASGSGCDLTEIFNIEGQIFYSFQDRNIICVLDLSKDGQTRKFEVDEEIYNNIRGGSLGFSSDGRRILTIFNGTVWMWDLSSGSELSKFKLKGKKESYKSVTLSPDSQLIATTSDDSTTRIWDLSGQQLAEFQEDRGKINTNAFQQKYAYQRVERSLAVNFLKRGVAVHGKNKMNVFSPDGHHIVTPSIDNSIVYVWDLLAGKQTAIILKGHQSEIVSVSFSPDGQRILTASYDGTARIWNLTGQQLAEFRSPDESDRFFMDASFSPDAQRIMVAGAYKVFIWQTGDLNQLLVRGCAWLKDYLATHPNAPKICHNLQGN